MKLPARGSITALATAAIAAITVAAIGFASRDRIREEWHLRLLRKGSDEERLHAVQVLGELRSARAVQPIIAEHRRRAAAGMLPDSDDAVFLRALVAIGRPILPAAIRSAARALGEMERATGMHPNESTASYWLAHGAIRAVYRGRPVEEFDRETTKAAVDLEGILVKVRDDPSASPDARAAAAECIELIRGGDW